MNRKTSLICLLIALALLSAGSVSAEEMPTITGEQYASAQYVPTILSSYGSFSFLEIAPEGAGYAVAYWYGTDEQGERVFVRTEENGDICYSRAGMEYRSLAETNQCVAYAWAPGSFEAACEEWNGMLVIEPFETVALTLTEDGHAAFEVLSVSDGDPDCRERFLVDAQTLRLISYTCAYEANGEYITALVQYTETDAPSPAPAAVMALAADDTYTVTLTDAKGVAHALQAPFTALLRFTDGKDDLILFRDRALTQPVDMIDPATEDVSGGVTLYMSKD